MITTWAKVQTILNLETSQITLVEELIPLVQQDYLHIRNKPFDVEGADTIYPIGAEMTAIKMIEHHLSGQRAGVASESLGDYSVSYQQDATDYPHSIIGGIKRYASWT